MFLSLAPVEHRAQLCCALLALPLLGISSGACSNTAGPAAQAGSGGSSAEAGSAGSSGTNGSAAHGGNSGTAGSSGSPGTAGAGCVPLPPPGYVPEGWIPFTEYSCSQPFYMPSSPEYLPKPLKWKPCPDAAQLPKGCEVQDTDWPHDMHTRSNRSGLWATPNGHSLLARMRVTNVDPAFAEVVVADLHDTGKILFAIGISGRAADGVAIYPETFVDGVLTLALVGGAGVAENALIAERQGVMLVDYPNWKIGVSHVESSKLKFSWTANRDWLYRGEGLARRTVVFPRSNPDAPPEVVFPSSTAPQFVPGPTTLVSGAAFTNGYSGNRRTILIHTHQDGARPLLAFEDPLLGAGNFGSDGKDIVWTFGEELGRLESGIYAKQTVMTAPFTTNPAELKPWRLRSDPGRVMSNGYAVGCGYAARHEAPDSAFVVRLSDGQSWHVPGTRNFRWPSIVGIDCAHVYAYYDYMPTTPTSNPDDTLGIARIRIADLGPGEAPD